MKVKKHQLFFWFGLALFAAYLAIYLVGFGSLCQAELSPTSPDDRKLFGFANLINDTFAYVVLVGPSLLVELSCIRSIYRILKYEPKGIVRICWLLSAVLSFSAFVFQILVFTGVVDLLEGRTNVALLGYSLLLTGIPVAIVSFLLCSIHKKQDHDKEQDNEGSNV